MFAYCNNNPVMLQDATGDRPILSTSTANETKADRQASFSYMNNAARSIVDQSSGIAVQPLRDVTDEVDKALNKAVVKAKSSSLLLPVFHGLGRAYQYISFYNDVNHYQEWDIKRSDSWELTIGTPFPGEGSHVIYHGEVVTPEYLGNYAYGALVQVTVLGFPFYMEDLFMLREFRGKVPN